MYMYNVHVQWYMSWIALWQNFWLTQYEDKSDIKFKFSTFNKNVARVKTATAGFDPDIIVREIQ